MVVSCIAPNCTQRFKKGIGVSFHSFPRDGKLRQKWKEALRLRGYNPGAHAKLCGRHFTSDCFEVCPWGKLVRLRDGSIPTIFDFPSDAKKVRCKRFPQDQPTSLKGTRLRSLKECHVEVIRPLNLEFTEKGIIKKNLNKRRKYYMGDFASKNLTEPTDAVKCLKVIQDRILKKNKQIRFYQRQERKLEMKIEELKREVDNSQKEFKIVDDAVSVLLGSNQHWPSVDETQNALLKDAPPVAPSFTASSPNISSSKPVDIIARLEKRISKTEKMKKVNLDIESRSIPWNIFQLDEELENPADMEVFRLAHTLKDQSQQAKGRDAIEVEATLRLLSYWPQLCPQARHYAFKRLKLLYMAMKKGWSYALHLFEIFGDNPKMLRRQWILELQE